MKSSMASQHRQKKIRSFLVGFVATSFVFAFVTLVVLITPPRRDAPVQTVIEKTKNGNLAKFRPPKSGDQGPAPPKESQEEPWEPPRQEETKPRDESSLGSFDPPIHESPKVKTVSTESDFSPTPPAFIAPSTPASSPHVAPTTVSSSPPTMAVEPSPPAKPAPVAAVPKQTPQKKPEPTTPSPSFGFNVEAGFQEILYPSGKNGIHNLPTSQIGFISTRPRVRVLLGVGGQGMLMEGKDLWNLQALRPVLTMQTQGVFCSGGSVVYDPKNKNRLLAFAFVNDGRASANNFYGVVSVAESFDGGNSFSKLVPVISSRFPNKPNEPRSFGSYYPSVILDKSRQFYYLYYTDLAESSFRGEQTCMARCSVRHDGAPGKWFKYHDGKFQEPGLGGSDTPLISLPNVSSRYSSVQYIKSIDRYVMAYLATFPKEWNKPLSGPDWKSGIFISISSDGISWSPGRRLFAAAYLARGEASVNVPTLVPVQTTPKGFHGYILYPYSERWGDDAPNIPFSLAGRKISLTLTDD